LFKKQKKRKGKALVAGGAIGLVVFFLLNGNLPLNLLGGGEQIDNEPSQVENQATEVEKAEIVIVVVGNKILVNEKEVTLDDLMSEVGGHTQVIYRAKDAKQITYNEVKSLLKSNDIVIIEE